MRGTLGRRQRTLGVVAVSAAALLAIAVAPLVHSGTAHAANARGKKISRREVTSRAQNWYRRNIQYSQSSYASDPDGSHSYRQDCSGFVSMAWHLGTSATTVTLPNYSHKISKSNLKRGDILDDPGNHTVLFHKWANSAHTKFTYYSESNPSSDMTHRTVYLSSYSGYSAYRYDKIFNSVQRDADTHALGSKCSITPWREVHLKNMRNVQIREHECIWHNSTGWTHAQVYVDWKPNSDGSDDSSVIGHAKFDGFMVHPQVQDSDTTKIEAYCSMSGAINAHDSGHRSCQVAAKVSGSGKSADGWLNWNRNNDGEGYIGAVYLRGSGVL